MIQPAHIQTISFFYPVGNTPPVCLTQYLPPDENGAILLLGCGDIRSILYTMYTECGLSSRTIDITCCDIAAEIIARNIFILTMILDNESNDLCDQIWDIYYNLNLDERSLISIQHHTKNLLDIAGDNVKQWADSKYGNIIRFADTGTFSKVLRLWQFYNSTTSPSQTLQKPLANGLKKAKKFREQDRAGTSVLNGGRSAAPCGIFASEDCDKCHQHYWKTGVTTMGTKASQDANHLNPLFGTLSQNLILHYGIDPLSGASLAAAYIPLADDSPLKPHLKSGAGAENLFETAKNQFRAYCKGFRSRAMQLTLRFVNYDVLALCHVIQHHQLNGESENAGWYRDNWQYEPLVLDTEDYNDTSSPHKAPLAFDVIDASNLIDHVGCINVLAAAAPLLIPRPTSTINTETLVMRADNIDGHVKSLLCGDLSTVALIMGLSPAQSWTDASTTSVSHEQAMHMAIQQSGISSPLPFQFRQIIV